MKAKSSSLTVLVTVLFFLTSFLGCSKKGEKDDGAQAGNATSEIAQNQAVSEGDNQLAVDDTSISDLVSLWNSGKKDEATEKFLSIDWQDAAIIKQIRGLSMPEEALISLSDNERQSIVQETMNLLGSMRKLFFHVASEAESLACSGDTAKAKEYLNAIRKYGMSLSGPEHLQVVQMHGKAAVGYAEKKLSEIK